MSLLYFPIKDYALIMDRFSKSIKVILSNRLNNLRVSEYSGERYTQIDEVKEDVFTDSNGYLNTVDTANTKGVFQVSLYSNFGGWVEDDTEESNFSNDWITAKTFYPNFPIGKVTSQLKTNNSDNTVKERVMFHYEDGTKEASSEASTSSTDYVDTSFTSPKSLVVARMDIQTNGGGAVAYERNDKYTTNNTILYSSFTLGSTTSTSYVVVKTLHFNGWANEVVNGLATDDNTAYCRMHFYYSDGSSDYSNEASTTSINYVDFTYNNPHPNKEINKINVELRISDSSGNPPPEARETYDKVKGGNISQMVVKTNTLSFSESVSKLLIFADLDEGTNASDNIEIYDTSDNLIGSGDFDNQPITLDAPVSDFYIKFILNSVGIDISNANRFHGYAVYGWND